MADLIDLTGKRFGRLVVLHKGKSRIAPNGTYFTTWVCKCDCGNETTVDSAKLRNGHTTSCGCATFENYASKKDIVGQRFGKLTVIKFVPKSERENPRRQWLCRCDCGNEVQVDGTKLRTGHTRSCGCLEKEFIGNLNRKYSNNSRSLYVRWHSIVQRCTDETFKKYCNYGGRGIKVCPEWLDKDHGFDNFCEWAFSSGYEPGLTIDRIDVNGDYEPSNCRWITNAEQQNNKRCNVMLTYNNETHTMKEWADILNVSYGKIRYHVRTCGMSLEEFIEKYV